jgi:hypothetical protein
MLVTEFEPVRVRTGTTSTNRTTLPTWTAPLT